MEISDLITSENITYLLEKKAIGSVEEIQRALEEKKQSEALARKLNDKPYNGK